MTIHADATSPKMDSQVQNRIALYKRRESPQFRDVLRKRCQSRIRVCRRALLDQHRHVNNGDGMREIMLGIVRDEIKLLLDGSPERWDYLQEEMEREMDNEERWILGEYEKLLMEEETTLFREYDQDVVCPLCERASLVETAEAGETVVHCPSCNKRFPEGCSLALLKRNIDDVVYRHNGSCDETSQFTLLTCNNTTNLLNICYACGCLDILI